MRSSKLFGLAAVALWATSAQAQSSTSPECNADVPRATSVCQTTSAREALESSRMEARALEQGGEHARALDVYRRLARKWPDVAMLQLDLGRVSERLQRRKEALDAYRRFTDLEPLEPRGFELLGWSLLELGRAEDALAAFRTATRLDPARAAAHDGAGSALAELGRHEEAIRSLSESARLNPENAQVWGSLARAAERVGRPRDAIAYWERALRASPSYFDARAEERQRWERAIAVHGPQVPASIQVTEATLRDSVRTTVSVESGPTSSGSGFFVSRDGLVLTNKHVIRGCSTLKVRGDSGLQKTATVSALDPANDLALLRTEGAVAAIATFRAGAAPRPGDDVVAVGYPLSGLLADQVNVSTGSINALAGMYNDQRVLQMSAPVQPGSSGGPLFDAGGNVVGVVVTKLNAKVVAEAMGDIPQNVNFALKGAIARSFLDANAVRYEEAPTSAPRSNADVGEIGRRVTVLVECWK
jgi:S1-C subfamily serine protease